MPVLSELATAVKARRMEMGLSQEKLAALVGLSRATINELENGKLSNLSLTRAERLANALGFAIGLSGSRRPANLPDALETAARAASVSYRDPLPRDVVKAALLTGEAPAAYRPHLRSLLDEAPLTILSNAAAQLEREAGVRKQSTWQHMRALAVQLACSRDIWR